VASCFRLVVAVGWRLLPERKWRSSRQRLSELEFISGVIRYSKIAVAPGFSCDTLVDLSATPFKLFVEVVEAYRKDVNRTGRRAFVSPK
jgi:hypothetical protein